MKLSVVGILFDSGDFEMIDWSDDSKLCLRGDEEATIRVLCTDKKGDYPFVVLINESQVRTYTLNGRIVNQGPENIDDIIQKPEWIEGYVNVYDDGWWRFHPAKKGADYMSMAGRVARIKVKYKPGQFDE